MLITTRENNAIKFYINSPKPSITRSHSPQVTFPERDSSQPKHFNSSAAVYTSPRTITTCESLHPLCRVEEGQLF